MTAPDPGRPGGLDPAGLSEYDQDFARAVRHLAVAVQHYLGVIGRDRYGVDASGGAALVALHRHGPMTAKQLAAAINLSPPATSEMVERLYRAGHITRSPHPTDRRKIVVTTTAATDELTAHEWTVFAQLLRTTVAGHDTLTREHIITTLTAATHTLEHATDQPDSQPTDQDMS